MKNKKLLIASSSRDEAITKWIINNRTSNSMIDLIFIDELLNEYDIQDELNDEKVCIQWYQNNTLRYTNETHCLLNRVTCIENRLFNHFKHQDREYAKREFESYLGFAFNSFKKVQNIAINGVCERIYSLPQQWKLIGQRLGLSVPNYHWGSKDYCNFEQNLNSVRSNIYNFLNWSSTNNEHNSTGFCFEKPEGEPVFVLSIGTSRLITTELNLTDIQLDLLDEFFSQIKDTFDYFIFELLIFVNQRELTFGCINIDVIRSRFNPLFQDFLNKNLVQEFYKCLN